MIGKLSCNVNLKNDNGCAALHLATQQNNYAGVLNLLSILTIDLHVYIIFIWACYLICQITVRTVKNRLETVLNV